MRTKQLMGGDRRTGPGCGGVVTGLIGGVLTICLLVAEGVSFPKRSPSRGGQDVVLEGFDWERAVSLYKQGQYGAAIREFQGILTVHPTHADSWKLIGLAHLAVESPREAIPALEKALELKRQQERIDPELRRALAEAYLGESGFALALPHLEWLSEFASGAQVGRDLYLLGVAYAGLQRGQEAQQAFSRSLELAPGNLLALQYLVSQSIREGRTEEAIRRLRVGLATAPGRPELWGLLTEALLRQAAEISSETERRPLLQEAVRSATRLIALREEGATLELLGRAHLAAGQYPQAERALSRSVASTDQPGATLLFQLGFTLVQLKSWRRAIEMLTRADQLVPRQAATLSLIGFAFENERRYPQAIDAYRRAYEAGGATDAELRATIERLNSLVSPVPQ
jgi:tetratricopeptide (TPR) repeat protein